MSRTYQITFVGTEDQLSDAEVWVQDDEGNAPYLDHGVRLPPNEPIELTVQDNETLTLRAVN